jgi:prolyl oligopeptidase
MVGNKIFANYMKDAHDVIKIFDLEGNYLYDLDVPVLGSIGGFGGQLEDTETFYVVTSFTTPSTIYRYDTENNVSEEYNRSAVDFDPSLYETKQVFYTSKDGTEVPMFIVHKKDLELDGNNPALLYGYGGFNISLTPSFSITRLALLENGFVFAMANLRGGGEYGEEWHEAGTLMQKQNVFDDFIAAAEFLIDNKYTSSDKLAIQGGSNGGLLIGAVINQRPDLFGVALPAVGVMDMLRYHKFTIGKYWATDYGTSEDSKEMFDYLYGYSPLHTIKSGVEYPAVLVTTADHDDRVVPAHSFKYIATLQENYQGKNPVMIRIETKAGHGAGKPTAMIIKEYADVWAFVMKNLGVEPVY